MNLKWVHVLLYGTKWAPNNTTVDISSSSVKVSALTSPSDDILTFETHFLSWNVFYNEVLLSNSILKHCHLHYAMMDVLLVLQEISGIQNVIFKLQKQITKLLFFHGEMLPPLFSLGLRFKSSVMVAVLEPLEYIYVFKKTI